MTLLDFAEQGGALPDLSDLDFRIWLGWRDDPDRLYVAFVASDDVYKNTHDYNAIRGSGRDLTPFDHLVHDDFEGSIISDLTAGEIIGFSIMVNDWDDDRYYSWTPGAMQRSDSDGFTDIVFLRADYFLDGILLPDDSTIRENDTAVESTAWPWTEPVSQG